jgi:hypothetical protein
MFWVLFILYVKLLARNRWRLFLPGIGVPGLLAGIVPSCRNHKKLYEIRLLNW